MRRKTIRLSIVAHLLSKDRREDGLAGQGILGTVGASLLAPAAVEVLVTAAGSLLQLLVE